MIRLAVAMMLAAGALPALGQPASEPTLYDQLGGETGIGRIVDGLLRRSVEDPRIKESFEDTNIDRLKTLLATQFCVLSGGPCQYKGRTMKASHAALGLHARHLDALVEDLQDAMSAERVPFRVQNRLLALLAPMRDDVVTK